MTKTNEQMLREIVRGGIDEGVNLNIFLIDSHKEAEIRDWYVAGEFKYRIEVKYFEPNISGSCTCFDHITIPDLLNDKDFMEAIYSTRIVCIRAGQLFDETCLLKTGKCGVCSRIPDGYAMTRHEYIAARAINMNGDEQIKFLYENMEE